MDKQLYVDLVLTLSITHQKFRTTNNFFQKWGPLENILVREYGSVLKKLLNSNRRPCDSLLLERYYEPEFVNTKYFEKVLINLVFAYLVFS